MQVVYSEHDLLPEEFGLDFSHLAVRLSLEVAVQRATVDVLHDQEHLLVRLESFVQLGQTIVIDFLHDFNFSLHALSPVGLE